MCSLGEREGVGGGTMHHDVTNVLAILQQILIYNNIALSLCACVCVCVWVSLRV